MIAINGTVLLVGFVFILAVVITVAVLRNRQPQPEPAAPRRRPACPGAHCGGLPGYFLDYDTTDGSIAWYCPGCHDTGTFMGFLVNVENLSVEQFVGPNRSPLTAYVPCAVCRRRALIDCPDITALLAVLEDQHATCNECQAVLDAAEKEMQA